ncbi:protein cup isoform X2 [Anopheles stephensi]|uniref:protein cup isoform X2 n=1 Tax=Anopheles stephensi TaxID=30069 RepID=UPI0016587592|nr:protein cup isoform X2 [Anopheles stephensi]
MMKFANSDTTTMSLRHGEQYENCSELLIEPDMTSLEELDPAILSCGLPAIVLNEEDLASTTTATTQNPALPSSLLGSFNVAAATAANVIRYTVAHLLALRKSPFSHRRPAAIDDPRTAQYPIWSRNGFNHQDPRGRRAGGGNDEEQLGYGRKPNDRQRDNGFNPPRFRRNHEFSNRNHHVIVKSYNAGDPAGHNGAMRLQDTIIEEEPEWVVGGPTSRLDTIELRGFDEDVSRTVSESLKTSPPCGKQRGAFFDELLHYEHVHPKHHGGAKHDMSGSAGDGESVSTSNNGSPPPARSTPTKSGPDMNNNGGHGRKLSGLAAGCSSSGGGGVNVSNFEELMKFDSILGDSGDSSSSRFNKYYHRGTGGVGSGSSGGQQHHYQNHHAHQHHHVRFALDRNTHHYSNAPPQHHPNRQAGSGRLPMSALQHPPAGVESYIPGGSSGGLPTAGDAKSFQRLLEMLAAQNQRNYQQHQQHYLLQLLQNCQETETLRQMLLKKCSLENAVTTTNLTGGGQSQSQRIPTQAELQQHTQTIMQQALLRKKIAEQSRYLLEQQTNGQEPIPAVQQLIQSICPNVQRSLSVLAGNGSSQHAGPEGRNDPGAAAVGGAMFAGGNRAGQMRHSNRRY